MRNNLVFAAVLIIFSSCSQKLVTHYTRNNIQMEIMNPPGTLKEHCLFLNSNITKPHPDQILFDHVRTGEQYFFDENEKLLATYDFATIYAYSLTDVIGYCKKNFPDNNAGISQLFFRSEIEIPIPLRGEVIAAYPYWNVTITNKSAENIVYSNVYLLDGKSGQVLRKSSFTVKTALDVPLKKTGTSDH